MSITVEFRDFEEMVGFAAQLLGRTDGNPQSGAQPEDVYKRQLLTGVLQG